MSRTITDEKIKLSIIIDGNSAQKELFDLEKATRKLTEENKALGLQKKLLEKQGKIESDEYKALTATIKQNTAEIGLNKAKMSQLQNEIGLTGLTMNQLTQKATILRMTLKNLIPGSADYEKYKAELTKVTTRISELSGKAVQSKFSLSSMADGFNKYQGLALSFAAGLTGVVFSVQKIIDINGKLSDAQADAMKTTGMNKREIDELTKSFGLLETRTSRIDLLKIAEQGGRLGIPKDEINDFVKSMNVAAVALGDSFTGGVDAVAEKLGKIKFLFKETKDMNVEQAYNAIGSAINDLGANGVASEENIAEFTKRIGSLTDVLKPTVQETLALGTAFEESGIEAETSSRAYNIFMKQASTESMKFSKVMNLSQKAVEDMINTSPINFMLEFAKGMRGMSATDTAKTLEYLGINADGANKVIGAMGNNFERFNELIKLSNNSFSAGTSLINEYNVKNENLAATLEKITKRISAFFSSETFIAWLGNAINWLAKFIGASEDADGAVGRFKNSLIFWVKILAVGFTAMISYKGALELIAMWTNRATTATALSNIVFKIQYGWLLAQEVATKGLALAQALLTFKVAEVRKAYVALMATMSLNPWGAIIAVIAAATAAYVAFSDATDQSQEVMKAQLEIANSITQQTSQQKEKVKDLVAIMRDENATLDQKKKALLELQKITGGYLEGLTLENVKTDEGIRLINRYVKAIDELAKAKALVEVKSKLNAQLLEADNKILALSLEKKANKNQGISGGGDDGKIFGLGSRNKKEIELEIQAEKENRNKVNFQIKASDQQRTTEITNLRASIKKHTDELKKVKQDSKKFKELSQDISTDTNALNTLIGLTPASATDAPPIKSPYKVFDPAADKAAGKKDPNSSKEDIAKLNFDNQSKWDNLLLKLQRQYEDARIAAMQDGYEKELAIENLRYEREIQDLESQMVSKEEIIKLDAEKTKAFADKDMTKYNALSLIREGWEERNKKLREKINQIEEASLSIHNLKLGIIEEKSANEAIQKADERFKRKRAIQATQFQEQLNGITTVDQAKELLKDKLSKKELGQIHTLDDAKKALQDEYNKTDEKSQIDYLNSLIQKLDTIMSSKKFEGIDLNLLTPEQKDRFQKQIEEAQALKAKLEEALNGHQTSDAKSEQKGKDFFNSISGNVDMLGYSPEQWSQAYDNIDTLWGKMAAGVMITQSLSNAWGRYSQLINEKENANLKRDEQRVNLKKTRFKKMLDSGAISQEQYNRLVEKSDQELDRKKAEIEYKQAKRKKTMDIVNAIINTAVGIMQAYAQLGPIGGSIAAAIIAGIGAVEVATISRQPLPTKGYEDGLYNNYVKREQDGKIFKSTGTSRMKTGLFSKPRILVGEGPGDMPEMIIDKQAFKQISPDTKNALLRELNLIKGFEQGKYNTQSGRFEVPAAPSSTTSSNDQLLAMLMQVVQDNTAAIKDLKDNPLYAIVSSKDWKSIKELTDAQKILSDTKNQSKK